MRRKNNLLTTINTSEGIDWFAQNWARPNTWLWPQAANAGHTGRTTGAMGDWRWVIASLRRAGLLGLAISARMRRAPRAGPASVPSEIDNRLPLTPVAYRAGVFAGGLRARPRHRQSAAPASCVLRSVALTRDRYPASAAAGAGKAQGPTLSTSAIDRQAILR